MNRKEEYESLLAELDNTPPALEYAVTRAKTRVKKSKYKLRLLTIPISSVAVFLIIFIIIVFVYATFAMACGRIPLLRKLAAAVTFSPSLSAAVENEYAQPIDLEQSENGITMRVEYVIVDQKQLNIFYSLHAQSDAHMDVTPFISNPDGTPLDGYSILYSDFNAQKDTLRQITVDFVDRNMPGSLVLKCKVGDNGSDSTFNFTLDFDPTYTQKGEVIDLNQSFVLDGQHLTVTTVEIYPTHICLNLADDENNTAWLEELTFYLENEKGKRFEAVGNGITATGSGNSQFMSSHRLESSFFSESRRLTLYITGAVWLDKNMERIKVDLANCKAEKLPEGVTFLKSVRDGNNWNLTFSGAERKANTACQLFRTEYYDEKGNKYDFGSWSSLIETSGTFKVQFSLKDYPFDTVYLSPSFSHTVTLAEPIEIKVK